MFDPIYYWQLEKICVLGVGWQRQKFALVKNTSYRIVENTIYYDTTEHHDRLNDFAFM